MGRHGDGSHDRALLAARTPPRPEFDEALLRLADQLLRAAEPAEVGTRLLDSVVTTYGFPRGVVVTRAERRLSLLARHGVASTPPGTGSSAAITGALDRQAPQVVGALSEDDEPWLAGLFPSGADLVVLPLSADERQLGALVLQVPTTLRDRRGRRLLPDVARQAAYAGLALERVQRLAQLQRMATTDDLTMIANRRSFLASLDREVARSVRRGEPVSLVVLDLDHFKQINDAHGHPVGDEALRNVAAALSIACRDLDTAARYGGEEFVVLLPDCGTDRCMDIAERLRAAVSAAPAVQPLTASAGVATFPAHAGDGEQLLKAADDALLAAKRAGRNRSVMSSGTTEPAIAPRTGPAAPASSGPPAGSEEDDPPPSVG